MANADLLEHIKSHPYWPIFEAEIKSKRPMVPNYNPEADNTEQWKSLSAQQKGFDLCCMLLKINVK